MAQWHLLFKQMLLSLVDLALKLLRILIPVLPRIRKEKGLIARIAKFLDSVDRCYKIHGNPRGYKFRSNNNSNDVAHQVSTSDDKPDRSNSFGGFVQNFNSNQYQSLMSVLSTDLSSSAKVNAPDLSQGNCLIFFFVSLSPLFSFLDCRLELLDIFVHKPVLLFPCILSVIQQLLCQILLRFWSILLVMLNCILTLCLRMYCLFLNSNLT